MTKTSIVSLGRWKLIYLFPMRPDDALDDHLGNALATLNYHGLLAEINSDKLNFSAIVRIDGPGAVDQRHALF